MQTIRKRLIVWAHRLHRWTGTALAVLMLIWFASGAVMTFARYPVYSDAERLAHSQPLTAAGACPPATHRDAREAPRAARAAPDCSGAQEESDPLTARLAGPSRKRSEAAGVRYDPLLPPPVLDWLRQGGLSRGRARLAVLEGEARWLVRDASTYLALRVSAPWQVELLDERRARAEVERVYGSCRGPAQRVQAPDQWTVGRSPPGSYPLLRFACDDASASEIYISTLSGEIIQQSTRSERILAWLGPIPHWIYPAVLRRERELWRDVVLWLSAIGCVVTLSGLIAGAHSWRRSQRSVQRQVYLRWHQRLGLGFGAAAFAWVFSGALSLEPFRWASPDHEPARAWSFEVGATDLPLSAAVERCREQLHGLRELELIGVGRLYALCTDARADTRIIDLADPSLTPLLRIPDAQLRSLAQAVGAQLTLAHEPDDYHYPTHERPIALPYARFALPDSAHTVLYFDPARGALIDQIDDKRRLERWLYHGLHSWDFKPLYAQRVLWRSIVIAAMLIGCALCVLGILIFTRRQARVRKR